MFPALRFIDSAYRRSMPTHYDRNVFAPYRIQCEQVYEHGFRRALPELYKKLLESDTYDESTTQPHIVV